MSSLISRLSPKTNSFEVGTGKTINVITTSDIAAALSFSQMPAISHDLIRARYLNETSVEKIESIATALMVAHQPPSVYCDLLKICAVVALIEFCKVPAGYKPSVRNRAMMCGLAQTTYYRMELGKIINEFAYWIEQYYSIGRAKLQRQFASLQHGLLYSADLDA